LKQKAETIVEKWQENAIKNRYKAKKQNTFTTIELGV
jgi:hypothetical protein